MKKFPDKNPVVIIQSRIGSTRLPGKPILEIFGKTLIEWVVESAGNLKNAASVTVATSDNRDDDVLYKFLQEKNIKCFRGSESDVLGRYVEVAKKTGADPIIRICGDNPLISSELMDSMIKEHIEKRADLTYCHSKVPLGSVGEVISQKALEAMNLRAKEPHQREHVTPYIHQNPGKFKINEFYAPRSLWGYFRLTIDEESDVMMFHALINKMSESGLDFNVENAVKILKGNPKIAALNESVEQKDWRLFD